MHDFLKEKLSSSYDDKTIDLIIDGLNSDRRTTFRVNTLKSCSSDIVNELVKYGISYRRSNIISDAFILPNYSVREKRDRATGYSIENLNMYKEGLIYLQSLSSMIPPYLIYPNANENILDMCAAPGGKTTEIQALSHNKSNLTAVELHKDRFERLKYNIKQQGANVYPLNINSLDLDDNLKFDKILLDVPCSGSGILDISDMRYDKYFTDDLINKCVNTQRKLIKKAYKLLKKGGTLVYSTCSLLREENEDEVNFALENGFAILDMNGNNFHFDIKDLSCGSSIADNGAIKIFPDDIYEGFFAILLIKK